MPRILPAPSCSRAGFTLAEVLVALVILAVTVTVLVQVHIGTLRAGGMARGMNETVTRLGNVAAMTFLGVDDKAIQDAMAVDGWAATVEGRAADGRDDLWKVWRVTSSNHPAPVLPIYLHETAGTAGKGGQQGESGK